MKTDHLSCQDQEALLHKHLIGPASIWAVLMLAACAVSWVESVEAPRAMPEATLAAPELVGSA
jgi:hypothetical protein